MLTTNVKYQTAWEHVFIIFSVQRYIEIVYYCSDKLNMNIEYVLCKLVTTHFSPVMSASLMDILNSGLPVFHGGQWSVTKCLRESINTDRLFQTNSANNKHFH